MTSVLLACLWVALPATAFAEPNAPAVSQSRGRKSGVVVLWPRLVPQTEDPELLEMAARLQARVYAAAASVVDYRRVDVRPRPERVCPHVGCRAPAVGLLIGHEEGGCVVVAVLGPPGATARELVPLVGDVTLDERRVTFRTPPESELVVSEFVRCTEVEARYDDERVSQLIQGLAEAK